MKKHLIALGIGLIAVIAGIFTVTYYRTPNQNLGTVAYTTAPTFVTASSTAFTLTTSSLRLLATSTPTRRLAASIQPVKCGNDVFLKLSADIVATANTGFTITASSSAVTFADYPNTPVVQGSVQGIMGSGTCTVLVTEWRSQY